MENKKRALITLAILIILISVFYIASKIITNMTGYAVNDGNIEDFVKCISEKNVKMYGAFWCGHCQNNKKMFGEKILLDYKVYVECDPRGENPQDDLCIEKGIMGYPTWEIEGKMYSGEMKLEEISKLTGCALK